MKLYGFLTLSAACAIVAVIVFVGGGHPFRRTSSKLETRQEDRRLSERSLAPSGPVASIETQQKSAEAQAPKRAPDSSKPTPTPQAAPARITSAPPSPPPPPQDVSRSLSDDQREKLTEFLDPAVGEFGSVAVVTAVGDLEARRYADQIGSILSGLGWRVWPGQVSQPFAGVWIRADSRISAVALRLQRALVAAGIDASAEFGATHGAIELYVGSRP